MTGASERIIASGPLRIWTEAFGDARNASVLLIMGATNPGILWPDEFCLALARGGFHVIRYDHRDTGRSSTVNFRTSPYDMNDMTRDAVAILDAYGIARAHIVGMSMGGFIAQLMALDFADRVRTLTLLMSSPDERAYLAAARSLGVAPADCLALEDSYNGVQAAVAAGMTTIMAPDVLPATDEMRRVCFAVVSDLHEVRAHIS